MSNSKADSNLVGTAVAAAAAGAALAYAAMKMSEKSSSSSSKPEETHRSKRNSYIYDDYKNDPILARDASENMIFPYNHEEKMRRRIAQRYAVEEENSAPRNSVTVKVPATSANMGPGCE